MMRCGLSLAGVRGHLSAYAHATPAALCARRGMCGGRGAGLVWSTPLWRASNARVAASAASLALGITKSVKSSSSARSKRSAGPTATRAGASMVTVDNTTVSRGRPAKAAVLTPPVGGAAGALFDEGDVLDGMDEVDDEGNTDTLGADFFATAHAEAAELDDNHVDGALSERLELSAARRLPFGRDDDNGDVDMDRATLAGSAGGRQKKKMRSATSVRTADTVLEAEDEDIRPTASPSTLLNPFKGLHAHLSRSYRLDQLASVASPHDILLARQEKKSTAFSFLRFASGTPFYQDHWASAPALMSDCAQHALAHSMPSPSSFARSRRAVASAPVPGYTLFNNNLGLDSMRVQSHFPLLVAQRLLLFSDSFRHFHALCGRENVPCDFYADIDLPDVSSPLEGERILLEVLNYLEVRLPGVGFTDPFFMVLANEQMQSGHAKKIGYHIHARSMTFAKTRSSLSLAEARQFLKVKSHSRDDAEDGASPQSAMHGEDDDLSDLVNVVDGSDGTPSKKGRASSSRTATRLIAFQDYRTVKLLADEVNQTIGRTVIDEACYRANGMLRCAFSAKLKSKHDSDDVSASPASLGGLLMPLTQAKDTALQKKLSAMEEVLRTMTDPEILEMTFCTRHLDTVETAKKVHQHLTSVLPPARALNKHDRLEQEDILKSATRQRFKLVRPRHVLGPQSAQSVEYDMYGNIVSAFLTEGAKWRRYKSVVAKLHDLPSTCATSYDIWVRIGLALHNFSNEDHVFEEWVKFSLRCPQKYSRESCRRKWIQFERNPDAQNWRRGFNYLNSTIWRQV